MSAATLYDEPWFLDLGKLTDGRGMTAHVAARDWREAKGRSVLPRSAVDLVTASIPQRVRRGVVAALVAVRLWVEGPDGFELHDRPDQAALDAALFELARKDAEKKAKQNARQQKCRDKKRGGAGEPPSRPSVNVDDGVTLEASDGVTALVTEADVTRDSSREEEKEENSSSVSSGKNSYLEEEPEEKALAASAREPAPALEEAPVAAPVTEVSPGVTSPTDPSLAEPPPADISSPASALTTPPPLAAEASPVPAASPAPAPRAAVPAPVMAAPAPLPAAPVARPAAAPSRGQPAGLGALLPGALAQLASAPAAVSSPEDSEALVAFVVACWCRTFGRTEANVTPADRAAVEARIAEGAPREYFEWAIRYIASPKASWFAEHNRQYLAVICGPKFEEFWNKGRLLPATPTPRAPKPPTAVPPPAAAPTAPSPPASLPASPPRAPLPPPDPQGLARGARSLLAALDALKPKGPLQPPTPPTPPTPPDAKMETA